MIPLCLQPLRWSLFILLRPRTQSETTIDLPSFIFTATQVSLGCILFFKVCQIFLTTPSTFRFNSSHSSRVMTPVQKYFSPPFSAFILNDYSAYVGHFLTSIQWLTPKLPITAPSQYYMLTGSTFAMWNSDTLLSTHSFLSLCFIWGFNVIGFITLSGPWLLEPLSLKVRHLKAVWQRFPWPPPLIVKFSMLFMLFDLFVWTCSLHPL